MKLWQKIFLNSLTLVIIAVNVISVMLVNNSHNLLIEREQTHAINEYEFFAASIANNVIYERLKAEKILLGPDEVNEIINDVIKNRSQNDSGAAVYDYSKKLIGNHNFINLLVIPEYKQYIETQNFSDENYHIKIFHPNDKYYMSVCSNLNIEGQNYFIVTSTDISEIYILRSQQIETVRQISIITAAIISLILLVSVIILLRPLRRINVYTKAIANGNYNMRLVCKGSIEFCELSKNMNIMADSIESNAAQLKKIAEDRQTFIANLAHEMKTPLTSILGFADLLKIKKNVTDKERSEYAGLIVDETKRLRSLSSKLMEIITIGSTGIDKTPESLQKMIDETGAALIPLLNKNSVTLLCNTLPVMINADEALFKSLLYNLIENAVKASAIGQQIFLNTILQDDKLVISIHDNGIGMSREDAQKVFEPFYMVDKSRSRKAGGAGLGLALCVQIAALHNAVLSIDSELGKGTTVYITISGDELI